MAKMTIERLTETSAFKRLSPQEQMFVISFVNSGGDREFATGASYDVTSAESRRTFGYAVLKGKGVAAVLRLYNDGVFLDTLKTELAARHTGKVKTQMRKLIALVKAEEKTK